MNPSDYQKAGQAQNKISVTDPMIGLVLDGRYEIQRLLGTGGMGAVYRANQVGLEKLVAIKVLHPHLVLDDRTVQRFKHEIKAMSTLAHPNLISITDVGMTPFDAPYFVMEYLECVSLAELLQNEVYLEPLRAKPIFLQIADALSHAHERGIIHRDLKPANILIMESNGRDFVKVVDLGVAKLIGGDGDSTSIMKLTRTGEVFGSPLYMAPEQVLGQKHDRRTDIYQLGCVMFETLTSVPPIVRPSVILTMNGHVDDPVPTFSEAMPDLPIDAELKGLETIVLKCLEKKPDARFDNMASLMRALENVGSVSAAASEAARADRLVSAPSSEPARADRPGSAPAPVFQESGSVTVSRESGSAPVFREQASPSVVEVESAHSNNKFILIGLAAALLVALAVVGVMVFSPFGPSATTGGETEKNHSAESPSGNKSYGEFIKIDYPARASDALDLRVLSVYEGDVKSGADAQPRRGTIDVDVSHRGKPLVLVLNAYMPTTWTVHRKAGSAPISQVLTVGYYPQTVKGLPPNVVQHDVYYQFFNKDGSKSDEATHKNLFEPSYLLYLDRQVKSSNDFQVLKGRLEEFTGLGLHKFTGIRTTDKFTVH